MAGLPWIKVWTRVGGHPKVQRLEKELGVKDGLGILLRLWCWTADYCPDGDIPAEEALKAAKEARGDGWRISPDRVLSALAAVGLLERFPQGYRVHDWDQMQTKHVEADEKRKAQGRERQRRWREKHNAESRNASGDASRNSEVTGQKEKETEKEIEKDSQPDRMAGVRSKLASALGRSKPLGVGKDAAAVQAAFTRWLDAVGEDFTVSECARVARDKGVAPSYLSWWPGWLDTVTDAELQRWREQGVA